MAENGMPVVKIKQHRRPRRYELQKLINAITEENKHPEIEWGRPVSGEVW
jgi:antitoxin component of MazEF toxin-antitoxin module